MWVEIQVKNYSEASAQGSGDQPSPRGSADERELRQLEFDRTRSGALPDQQVKLVVLHRGIKLFFQCGQQAMNLIDEQHVAFLEVCQQGSDVAGFLDRWTGSRS